VAVSFADAFLEVFLPDGSLLDVSLADDFLLVGFPEVCFEDELLEEECLELVCVEWLSWTEAVTVTKELCECEALLLLLLLWCAVTLYAADEEEDSDGWADEEDDDRWLEVEALETAEPLASSTGSCSVSSSSESSTSRAALTAFLVLAALFLAAELGFLVLAALGEVFRVVLPGAGALVRSDEVLVASCCELSLEMIDEAIDAVSDVV